MQQSRAWNLGSLNEFRKFFGLKAHETFEDICSDPPVADQLKHLYAIEATNLCIRTDVT